MYYIKEIQINPFENTIKIIDGLRVYEYNNEYILLENFWGKSRVNIGMSADTSSMYKGKNLYLIPYANEIHVKNLDDGYRDIAFYTSSFKEYSGNEYVIIIKYGDNIKTNGNILFKRYDTEIVAVLKEGDFLEVSGKRFEVNNYKLCMIV